MLEKMIFEGRCWKFGHNVPTDAIAPTHVVFKSFPEMAKHVFESVNPEFAAKVEKGDIVVAGRNFGCSSGRAIAAKALMATGIGAVVAEKFSRTFYRNGHEIGLPILEAPGIHDLAQDGHRLRVDVENGILLNLSTGDSLKVPPPEGFLLEMLRAGGLIPYLKAGGLLQRQ
jgi:3-isopropylmalate/(R)-2-methylmalate dehydratase small subunit